MGGPRNIPTAQGILPLLLDSALHRLDGPAAEPRQILSVREQPLRRPASSTRSRRLVRLSIGSRQLIDMSVAPSASETSPLLHDSSTAYDDGITTPKPDSTTVDPAEPANTPHDEESLTVPAVRNFDGIPELQARMKYIFPALAIGVRLPPVLAGTVL